MDLLQRFTAHFSTPHAPPRIYLDPEEAMREQAKKAYRHHVFQIPCLRAFGLSLIVLFVLLHNLYLIPTPSARAIFWRLLVLYTLYLGASWLILRIWYSKVQAIHLGLFFLLFDIILFLVAIYYSGGEKSWLFFLLMVRTADQTRTTWKNTLLFANASTVGYVLLLLYLGYFEQHALSLPAELTKVCFIYAANIYLSFVAKAADDLRQRMNAAIRVSRDLIRQLEAQSSALQASEREYRALVEGSIQGVCIHQQSIVQLANPALARIFGYESPDVLIGLDYATLVAPHERDRLEGYRLALLEGRPAPERHEYQGVRRDGTFVRIESLVSYITWRGAPAILSTLQDITARRQAEEALQNAHAKLEARVQERTAELQQANEALRKSEQQFRQLFGVAPVPMCFVNKEGVLVDFNNRFVQTFGYTHEDVPTLLEWSLLAYPDAGYRQWVDDTWDAAVRCTAEGKNEIEPIEYQVTCKNGEVRTVVVSGTTLGDDFLAAFFDITERKRADEEKEKLQAQLNQAHKMESVGRLAGGVAHDFNNMLGVILGHTELALMEAKHSGRLRANLEEILKAALRSADLTRQLLAFARKQTVAPKVLNLNDTVESMLKMLRRLIGEDIELIWIPGASLWPIKIDPAQIDQILANLTVNARDAIPAAGSITLSTENVVLDDSACASQEGFVAGKYVLLTVSDTGSGMDGEVLDHIFEPFFTTKEVGRGTGLGLATVYGIARQNNGFIDVHSTPGKGTTFQICLPAFEAMDADTPSEKEVEIMQGGSETILVVEDDEGMLHLTKAMLEMLGYKVYAEPAPERAISIVEEHADIDLLIADVVMPEMNGRELVERLRTIRPDLRFIHMSGHTAEVIARRGVLEEGVHFIQKPFSVNEIAKKVREALED